MLVLRGTVALPLLQAGLTAASRPSAPELLTTGASALLLIGLWTPLAGAVLAVTQLGLAWSHWSQPWVYIQCGALSAALAMLGPGGCSVDARLFGRKTIQIPPR